METKEDKFLEKIILFLIVLVGAVLVFNQFQFAKLTSGWLNMASMLLVLVLIGSVVWMLVSDKKPEHKAKDEVHEKKPWTLHEKLISGLMAVMIIMVFFNQSLLGDVGSLLSGKSESSSSFIKSVSKPLKFMGGSSGKGGVIIGPQMNPDGRTTRLVEFPTISGTPAPQDTGNPTQDAINAVIPTGVPNYVLEGPGSERLAGITFDDPIVSQKVWASLLGSKRFGTQNEVILNEEETARYERMVSTFTCDYCCGGPTSVTPINRCGCAHSYAWQGQAKFFIHYYPELSDEQIMGEMTKWKALWYPQGMIQDYMVYNGQMSAQQLTHGGSIGIKQQFLNAEGGDASTQATAVPLDELPSMVGGC
jgi:hypothetical protein